MPYDVYAWNYETGFSKMVAEGVDKSTASDLIEHYLNLGMDWDAYMEEHEEAKRMCQYLTV